MISNVYITAGEEPAWFRMLNNSSLFSVYVGYFPSFGLQKRLRTESFFMEVKFSNKKRVLVRGNLPSSTPEKFYVAGCVLVVNVVISNEEAHFVPWIWEWYRGGLLVIQRL